MTISKALRFEVLRRDGFACSYCGRKPPEVELHIDHVVPAALGGLDAPENLRTSCADCNAGKGSTPPDAEMVAQVADDAHRWADAITKAGNEMAKKLREEDLTWLSDEWSSWSNGYGHIAPMPSNWQSSARRWMQLGLPREVIIDMVRVAMERSQIPRDQLFNYFAGCCWRQVTQMQERAAQLVADDQ